MRNEAPTDPPEEKVYGLDWNNLELYGYEEGFMIEGEFVPVEDAEEYLEDRYGKTKVEDWE